MVNTLRDADRPVWQDKQGVYLSFWMTHPAEAALYSNLAFCCPFRIGAEGMRLLVDDISFAWMSGRRFKLQFSGGEPVKLSGLLVGPAPAGAANDVPLARWLDAQKQARRTEELTEAVQRVLRGGGGGGNAQTKE